VDGNTVNQPLMKRVIERVLGGLDPLTEAAQTLRQDGFREEQRPWVYAILCARVGAEMTAKFAAGRGWQVSLQLHMALADGYESALRVGRFLHDMVPNALVKVPFRPDHPVSLLVARDLERSGVPVNLTSTFSARQVVAAALLANVARTNVFMGRIEQGLEANLLGEYIVLEAQRALAGLRRRDAVTTQLIVASMRDWRTFARVAGCDAFTAPCDVLNAFMDQEELAPEDIHSQLESVPGFQVADEVLERVGLERIARLHRVTPEYLAFLRDLRGWSGFARMVDGDELRECFESAGFGDVFHSPTAEEREELNAGKLPDLDGGLIESTALDTHYSLLANADFERHQAEIDAIVQRFVASGKTLLG
jgi:transaldolase